MLTADLNYPFPEELIATEPQWPPRVAFVQGGQPHELTFAELLLKFHAGDLLVINDSSVIPARIFSEDEIEILFLKSVAARQWEVLFPARDLKVGEKVKLP